MSFQTLTGLNKAAVLLMSLGEEASAKVFEELSDEEIRLVTRTIATIDHIPEDVKDTVFTSFTESQRMFAGLFIKGNEFAKKAISGLEAGPRTDLLLDQFISGTETRPLETIALMQPTMVAGLLEKEHPQTVSLVLSTQHVSHAGEILSHLPEEMRADVVYRIAMIGKVSPEVLNKIEDALHREIGQVGTKQQSQVGGIDKVVDILNNLKDSMDSDILDDI